MRDQGSGDISSGVLVVGAGPTGLTLAAELARQGVPVRLIDRSPTPSAQSRAIAIQARTLETLTLMRVAEEFTSLGHCLESGNVYSNGRHIIHLSFDGLDTPYPYILTIPQPETERILAELAREHGVVIERGVALTALAQDDRCVTATLTHADGRTETVRAAYAAGCDGARSTVREQLGVGFEGHTYPQTFALADVHIRWALSDDAAHVFTHGGDLCGIFPLGHGRHRITADNPPFREGVEASMDDWQALVSERAGVECTLSAMRWSATFHVNSRLVDRLRVGRVFLAGDAAHIHSPAGGQGMNTGIQDAVNLAWKIALVLRGVSDELLDTYQQERYPVERGVLRQTDFLINMVGAHGGVGAVLRDRVAPVVSRLGLVRRNAGRIVSEIAIRYHDSPIIEDHLLPGGPSAGSRAPDAIARLLPAGHSVRVLELCARPEHTLLAMVKPGAADDAAEITTQLLERVPFALRDFVVPVVITDASPSDARVGHAVREPRSLRDEYGETRPALYLVRPDGYIAFRTTLDSGGEAALCRYFDRLVLGGPPAPTPRFCVPPA